ncbi:MAG: aspartyl protease family protein [Sedimentisphaerales bacterium]
MKSMNLHNSNWTRLVTCLAIMLLTSVVQADRSGWRRQEVDWRLTGGDRIKVIRYPENAGPPLLEGRAGGPVKAVRKRIAANAAIPENTSVGLLRAPTVVANVIDSPPIAGFVPRIAVAVTDERSDDYDWVAEAHTSVVGRYLTDAPETDYAIGLFDTGASTHVMGYAAANQTGIYDAGLLTSHTVELFGATSSVLAWVSQPLAVYMDGLGAIDPNTMTVNDANMVGQSNVSIVVGDEPLPDQADLPTALGSPMSVNFVATINNDRPITVTYDGNDYTAPDIHFYDHFDMRIPVYSDTIPLNLIPAGAVNIQYIVDLESIFDFIFEPGTPSVIVGNSAQSLFFVDSADLYDGTRSAIDKKRFMLDTGAQITVISSGVGSRLGVDPANPDFEVDITDATGAVTVTPGFYLDTLEIPALGHWLTYTNVPVVLLDVASPEGGVLDGIIGMNLLANFNLVLHGGGLQGDDLPSLEYQVIPTRLLGDIAPEGGDGVVNFLDLDALTQAWLSNASSPNWNPAADIAPQPAVDGSVNLLDFLLIAQNWHKTAEPQ